MDKKYLSIIHMYGLSVMVSFVVLWIVLFVALSFNNYVHLIGTNSFYEHWIEFFILVSGFLCFIFTYSKVKIRFKKIIVR